MPMIEEILLGLATSGSGMLPLGEQQLLDLTSGNTPLSSSLYDLVGDQIDTTNLSKPHAYLVYTMFDAKMNLMEESSGVLQVQDPNERKTLDALDLHVPKGGYLHTYVTNSGTHKVNFDKFTVLRLQGKTREIFHYYPYGLEIHGINATQRKYKYRYSGKELQTAEWGQDGHGLELYDFGSRYYQATTGRWHVPDPAEQFHNPYLAMGNNPVVYVDPNGESIVATSIIVGALIGGYIGGTTAEGGELNPFKWEWDGDTWAGVGIGAVAGAAGGYAFAVSGPALASTSFFANFGTSGSMAAYTIAGAASMGATGYVAGIAGGMLHSDGNLEYAHQSGMFGFKLGSSIGAVLGIAYGFGNSLEFEQDLDDYQLPSLNSNGGDLLASANDESFNSIFAERQPYQIDFSASSDEDMYLIYENVWNYPSEDFYSSSFTVDIAAGTHVRLEMKNMNYLGARVRLSDQSRYRLVKNFLGYEKKVFQGRKFGLFLIPSQTVTKHFYQGVGAPQNYSFYFSAVSDVVNMRIRIYSNWKP